VSILKSKNLNLLPFCSILFSIFPVIDPLFSLSFSKLYYLNNQLSSLLLYISKEKKTKTKLLIKLRFTPWLEWNLSTSTQNPLHCKFKKGSYVSSLPFSKVLMLICLITTYKCSTLKNWCLYMQFV